MVTWDYRRYELLIDRMKAINKCTYNLARFHENGPLRDRCCAP